MPKGSNVKYLTKKNRRNNATSTTILPSVYSLADIILALKFEVVSDDAHCAKADYILLVQ